jgi:hypothetical protein
MVRYVKWEEGKGLEEHQAKIYNEAIGNSINNVTTVEQIIERNKSGDLVVCNYAFDDDKPLAYAQARDYKEIEETHIGYPWALAGCPEEVQDKLFDKMVEFVKKRESPYAIRANVGVNNKKLVDFFRSKGLVEKSHNYRYDLDLGKLSEDIEDSEYNVKIGVKEDINKLVELIKEDGRFSTQFPTDESIKEYFESRVYKDAEEKGNKPVLVFKDDKLVMASAPLVFDLPNDEERMILRFHSFLKGYEQAYPSLLRNVAKMCLKNSYGTDFPISAFHGSDESIFIEQLKKYKPNKALTGYGFGFKD